MKGRMNHEMEKKAADGNRPAAVVCALDHPHSVCGCAGRRTKGVKGRICVVEHPVSQPDGRELDAVYGDRLARAGSDSHLRMLRNPRPVPVDPAEAVFPGGFGDVRFSGTHHFLPKVISAKFFFFRKSMPE